MAINASVCAGFLLDLARGIHRPTDTYKLALYQGSASLSARTSVYSAAHEVPDGPGYKAGGCVVSGYHVTEAGICFDDPCFEKATITNPVGALIYNASKGDRAVVVIRFHEPVASVLGLFDVDLPNPTVPLVPA